MRFIIYGVGAIGGTLAAALSLAGESVVGIARGAQLEAIRRDGLLLRTPERQSRVRFECVGHPREMRFGDDDVVVLTVKSQDTEAALLALRAAGVKDQPVLCAQNGIANERAALRLFANVLGVTVMMPADYVTAGEVSAFGTPRHGIFEVGRYPTGRDETVAAICAALERANFAAFAEASVMESKYGKLLLNLRNIIEASVGKGPEADELYGRAGSEAEAAYRAAGIAWRDVGRDSARREAFMRPAPINGAMRTGGSSTQSLQRGAGSIETDFLNGEIVLLGRLHGVATPVNAGLCRVAQTMVVEGRAPGTLAIGELERIIAAG